MPERSVDELEIIDAMRIIKFKYEELLSKAPAHSIGTDLFGRCSTFLVALQGSISARNLDNATGVGVLAQLFQ